MSDVVERGGAPVFIAGAGPVGLILALELAHHGVRSIVIDREPRSTEYPKMDITNGRSMELFRRFGFAAQLRAVGVPPQFSFDVIHAVDFRSPPVARIDLPSVAEQERRLRAVNDGSMPLEADQRGPQSTFEALGRKLLRESPLIDFREGWTFERFDEDDDGVDVVFSETEGGRGARARVQYLVGCDGAASRVRRQLGIELDGVSFPKVFLIHFKSRDLKTLHRYGQFWHYACATGIVIIAQDEKDTWTAHIPAPPDQQESWAPDPEALITELLGAAVEIDEVLLTGLWTPRMRLADSYGSGRVFLAGDAVHQVIPAGGYGMNTGVADAVDIGWKLAAVVNGWGGSKLLESYGAERRPVAEANRQIAGRNVDVFVKGHEMIRAGELEAAGAYLLAERGENEFDGVEFGYRYAQSPVIVHEAGEAPPWTPLRYVPSTWPGARVPSFYLQDGSALFDRLGREFTLVDFTGAGEPLAAIGRARGAPVTYLRIREPGVRAAWERDLVLVRPDHHVAWRSDAVPSDEAWARIVDQVCGR